MRSFRFPHAVIECENSTFIDVGLASPNHLTDFSTATFCVIQSILATFARSSYDRNDGRLFQTKLEKRIHVPNPFLLKTIPLASDVWCLQENGKVWITIELIITLRCTLIISGQILEQTIWRLMTTPNGCCLKASSKRYRITLSAVRRERGRGLKF